MSSAPNHAVVYRLALASDWEAAKAAGVDYAGEALDSASGFIHFSTLAQAQETAKLYFRGNGSVCLLTVDVAKLPPGALKWEPVPQRNDLMPHLYGPLPLSAVVGARRLDLSEEGVPMVPAALLGTDRPAPTPTPFRIKTLADGAPCSMGVGVGVFVVNEAAHPGCVLLGRRKGSDGSGTWALPGGHLDFGETFEACAAREVREETGCGCVSAEYATTNNAVDLPNAYHYVVIFVLLRTTDEPQNLEPDKCEGWEWVRWDSNAFPQPLFKALDNVRQEGYQVPFQA